MSRIDKDYLEHFHGHHIYLPTRTIYIGSIKDDDNGESGVDSLLSASVIKNLHVLDYKTDEPINIILNNPGGDWYHGMAIYDAIRHCKNYVTVTVFGHAMSMSSIILQAADERVIAPHTKIMIHDGWLGLEGEVGTVLKWAEEEKKVVTEMENLYLKRIQTKYPKFTRNKLRKLLERDTILTASEAIELGLADKLLGE
jgi:ATP-dependent Clp protease protease subunit